MRNIVLCFLLFFSTLFAQAQFQPFPNSDEVYRESVVDAVGEIWSAKISVDDWLARNEFPEQWVVDGIEYHSVQSPLPADDLELRIVDFLFAKDWQQEEQLRLTFLAYESGADWLLSELQDLFHSDGSERFELLKDAYLGFSQLSDGAPVQVARDLFQLYPDVENYRNGRYFRRPRLFMFCRTERKFPCMMLMRDQNNRIVRNEDGSFWHQPSLGFSREKLPYNRFNGFTPAGVWRIDGVMPEANRPFLFGAHRRLMLEFVEKSEEEILHKFLLPESSHNQDWWLQSVAARDIGRGLFRIHGTGQRNSDVNTSYYPFVPTIGCVAQRENIYDGVRFEDQQFLLNKFMSASGLEPTYENETAIRALFYVIELNSEAAPVALEDLIDLGIVTE